MKRMMLCSLAALVFAMQAHGAEVMVAVAANFAAPMKAIAQSFENETGHKLVLSLGSTGNIYAQIRHGAPFEAFLAADAETPRRLEKEGLGVAGSRLTYATGRLVLWSPHAGFVDKQGDILRRAAFQRLAMANPKLAPYGAAAWQVMAKLGLEEVLKPKLVQGENIAQAYQFVVTENAQLGFVALSQVFSQGQVSQGSAWVVPAHLHAPLQQDAILLARGQGKAAVRELMAFLKSDKAKAIIQSYGYDL